MHSNEVGEVINEDEFSGRRGNLAYVSEALKKMHTI